MSRSLFLLALGLICAGVGGELFLRAVTGLALTWRLSAAFAGSSLAAFATSSPELSVALGSALAGTPEIALGDCIGSNVVNVALILGGALLLGPLHCSREGLRRDLPMALGAPALTALLALDGTLSRLDGALMVAAFFAWVAVGWRDTRRPSAPDGARATASSMPLLAAGFAGLGLLVLAAKLIVSGALGVAATFAWPPFVVGAVIVAVGTSTPEIVTTWFARLRGQDDIGLGTVLGSNVFNLLFIVAMTAIVQPIRVRGLGPWLGLGFGLAALLVAYPLRHGIIGRGRAAVLLGIYALHVGATIWLDSSRSA